MVFIGNDMITAIAERPAAVAAALLIATPLAPLASLACLCTFQLTLITVTDLLPAVFNATLELAGVAAAWIPYVSTVLGLLAAFAAAAFVIKVSIGVAIDIAGRVCRQLTLLFAVLPSLLHRAAQAARTSVLRGEQYAASEEPRLYSSAREHSNHFTAIAGIHTCTIRAARRTAHALVAPVTSLTSLLRCVAHPPHACVSHVAQTCTPEEPRTTPFLRAHVTQMFSTVHSIASQSLHTAFSPPALTASHTIAQDTDDIRSNHRPAHVRSATLFTRARALIPRHSAVLRFVCTLCLVWSIHEPVHSTHTSVSPALSSPHSLHAPASAAHQPAAASAAHASTPRIASPASPLSPLSRAAEPPMSHNAPTVAFHTVCTLAKHTSLVAPLAATLHNHTVSTPTDGPLCCTSLIAHLPRLTTASAYFPRAAAPRRFAHICASVVTAMRTFCDATFRAAACSTKHIKAALRAFHAAAAAELIVDNSLSSLRSITLPPDSRTSSRWSPTNHPSNKRKSLRHRYFFFIVAAACLLSACAATFVFSVAYAASAHLSPAPAASPARPHRQRGCRGGRRCHRATTPTDRTAVCQPSPTQFISDARTQTLLWRPPTAFTQAEHVPNIRLTAHAHTQHTLTPRVAHAQSLHSATSRAHLMRFSDACVDAVNGDALLSRRASARRRRNKRRRQRFGTPIVDVRLRDLRRAYGLELQPRRRRRRGRRRSRRNRDTAAAYPSELTVPIEQSNLL
uniref:Uncharacterized protein n=1 Tax=Chrysotila carterae TaxID=13221 RepID=A0A7S4F5H2_CHRCT